MKIATMFSAFRRPLLAGLGIALVGWASAAYAAKVVVITPYLAQPGTQFYVEGFKAEAAKNSWEVNVIDTAGDVAAVVSRLEDAVNQKVDAIVINVDPAPIRC
jgi:ribose transport system substrate-binding protein